MTETDVVCDVTPVAVPVTVTVYAPTVVPGLPEAPPLLLPLLPQPTLNPRARVSASAAPRRLAQRRRLSGVRKKSRAAVATPPPIGSRGILPLLGTANAAEAAVVDTVRVAV